MANRANGASSYLLRALLCDLGHHSRCDALLLHNDDHFSSPVPFAQLPDSLRGFAQWVIFVDDERYLSGFNEISQGNQIL